MKNAFWDNPRDRKISIIVMSVIGALLVFKMGMFVGYHKAIFSYRSEGRGFATMSFRSGPGMMPVPTLPPPSFRQEEFGVSHGTAGRVISVTLPSFVVASTDNTEKTVTVGNDTLIRRFKKTVPPTDIQANDYTVVVGNPDESGAINARFIRLMPAMFDQAESYSR